MKPHIFVIAVCLAAIVTTMAMHDRPPAEPAAAPTPVADSDTVHYNAADTARDAILGQSEAGMEDCFDRALHGLLSEGVRSRGQLLEFAETSCGSGYEQLMVGYGASKAAAHAYVDLVASQQLDGILRNAHD
jgi:hypothetical protein